MEVMSNCGSEVICDFCNGDGRFSMGGVLVGSYAVCGGCSLNHGWMEIAQFNKNLGGFHVIVEDIYTPVFLEIINEIGSLKISKAKKNPNQNYNETTIQTDSNKYLLRYTDKALEEFSKDEISELWDLDKTFQNNVLAYRKEQTGSSDGISYFMSFDEFFNKNKESK